MGSSYVLELLHALTALEHLTLFIDGNKVATSVKVLLNLCYETKFSGLVRIQGCAISHTFLDFIEMFTCCVSYHSGNV